MKREVRSKLLKLLVTKGIATRNENALGAPGLTTRSKYASSNWTQDGSRFFKGASFKSARTFSLDLLNCILD